MIVATKILDEHGRPITKEISSKIEPLIRARYDLANQGSEMLQRVWNEADKLSPDNANRLAIRRWLRERSRYECVENNAYLIGTIRMIVNDMVGSGPKLQITDKRISPEQQRQIEEQYARWTKAINYREKLALMRTDKIVTGEAFKLSYTNKKVRNEVQLDFRCVEADRITTEYFQPEIYDYERIRYVDGIEYDRYENPKKYYVLKSHPGGYWYQGNPLEGDWVNAIDVRHWYRKDRSWHRGIPELTTSLPLCALLRRYTLAVVLAAETAADFAAVLESEAPPNMDSYGSTDSPFDTFPIDKGLFTTLPWGYKLSQIKAEQPVTHYDEFVNALIKEIIHPLLVPFNYHSGSSANSNMASAAVDIDVYKRMQHSERLSLEANVLDEDAWQWFQEGVYLGDYFGEGDLSEFMDILPDHHWRWDQVAQDHSDPMKVANALKVLHDKKFLTDRDIQESRFNRSLEDWQEDIVAQTTFRKENSLEDAADIQDDLARQNAAESGEPTEDPEEDSEASAGTDSDAQSAEASVE
ncbi:MAG TPA: phage portal protein [Pirellulales bacterium]|nr:phage portal protein [Pirellulales bacterium]